MCQSVTIHEDEDYEFEDPEVIDRLKTLIKELHRITLPKYWYTETPYVSLNLQPKITINLNRVESFFFTVVTSVLIQSSHQYTIHINRPPKRR